MHHWQMPRSRVEIMELLNTHHLKPSSQIERKTWSGNQIPEHAIDQNSAKWLENHSIGLEITKVVKINLPTSNLLVKLSNVKLLLRDLLIAPVNWRQKVTIDNGDHFCIKNWNIHVQLRLSTLLIGQNKQVRLTKLNQLKNKILVHQIIQNRAFQIFFIL